MTATDERAQTAPLVDEVRELVECESPSHDTDATAICADLVASLGSRRLGGEPQRVVVDDHTHLRWSFGDPKIVLLGHLDTVWPTGTLSRWPFRLDGDRMTGPGVFDMKAGIVQLFAALSTLDALDGIAVLVTSDEEVGSPTSTDLIQQTASGATAALVLEPSAGGDLKIARKGVGMFTVHATGRAAHAGLAPETGVNATIELAHQVLDIAGLADSAAGTTVTPTVVTAGTTVNTVPAAGMLSVDVRATTIAEMKRVEDALTRLRPALPGSQVKVTAGSVRPPFETASSAALFERALEHAQRLGLGPLGGVAVGGGSDGNLTAAIGVPTLDGLGPVGDNAHAEGEWASVAAMPKRAALVAALVRDLLEAAP